LKQTTLYQIFSTIGIFGSELVVSHYESSVRSFCAIYSSPTFAHCNAR